MNSEIHKQKDDAVKIINEFYSNNEPGTIMDYVTQIESLSVVKEKIE